MSLTYQSVPADPPFFGWRVSKPFIGGGRKCVYLSTSGRSSWKMTVARYKMCVYLGFILSKGMEVDHIDEDRTNDSLSNLQVLSRCDNSRKAAAHKGRAYVELRCPWCSKTFIRERRQTFLGVKGRKFTTCGRSCGGRLAHFSRQVGRAIFDARLENVLIREFRKRSVFQVTPIHSVGPYKETSPIFEVGGILEFPEGARGPLPGARCSVCRGDIASRGRRCVKCASKRRERVAWPSVSELLQRVEASSYVALGRELGVSDNAIRKRIRNHAAE